MKQVALGLCIVIFSLLFIMLLWHFGKDFKCEFLDTHINVCWLSWTYRRVEYNDILGIKVDGAYNSGYFPIVDKSGKQKAVISLYKSKTSFLTSLLASGMSIIPGYEFDRLCYSYFNKVDFQMLLRKTNVTVFITLEMFLLYKEDLFHIFEDYPNRVMISGFIVDCNSRQLVSYDTLKNRYKII